MTEAGGAESRLKSALANATLVLVSILISYSVLELIFFRLMLPHLPLTFRVYLPVGSDLRPQIDKFLNEDFAAVSAWRCHGHLGDTIWKMLQFHVRYGLNPDLTYHVGPVPPINRIVVDGIETNAREFNVPSLALE